MVTIEKSLNSIIYTVSYMIRTEIHDQKRLLFFLLEIETYHFHTFLEMKVFSFSLFPGEIALETEWKWRRSLTARHWSEVGSEKAPRISASPGLHPPAASVLTPNCPSP